MKWRVTGTTAIGIDMRVEADTQEEAIEKAGLEWPGLTNYCGNGKRGGALLGPSEAMGEHDANVSADDGDAEFTDAAIEEED